MWQNIKKNFSRIAKKVDPVNWFEKQQTSIVSAALIITIANLFSSVAGLFRSKLMISRYFDTIESQKQYEAFGVAFQIPDLMYQLIILGALSAAFIPVFTKVRKEKGDQEAFKMTSIVMSILLGIFTISGILIFIFARQITVWRTGVNFTSEQIDIVVNLTRIMIFSQFFFAVSNFFTGILQSYQKFIIPAVAPIFYNVGIVLGTYLFYDKLGIYSAGVGVIIGSFMHMSIQWPYIKKLGFKYWISFNWHFSGVLEIFKMMPARLMTVGITEIQSLGLGFFATQIGDLSFFIITHARSIIALPIRFFGVPIAQAALPFLSEQAESHNKHKFRQTIIESLNQISFLAVPASVLVLILRIPLVRIIYGTKNFPWSTTVLMGRVIAIIAISVAAQAIYTLLVRAFHALQDTLTPFYLSFAITVLFILCCYLSLDLPDDQKLFGLALTISLTGFMEALIHLLFLQKKVGGIINKKLMLTQSKIIFSGVIMAIALYVPLKLLDNVVFDTTKVLPLLALTSIVSLVGFGVYFFLAWLLRIEEQKIIWKIIRKFNKKKLQNATYKGNEPIIASADTLDELI